MCDFPNGWRCHHHGLKDKHSLFFAVRPSESFFVLLKVI